MQNSQFERLLKLAQRTGDRLIVTDPSGREPVVILPLSEYEGLLDYDSFRHRGEDSNLKKRTLEDVQEFKSIEDEPEEMEGEFDPEALEEQVIAAMAVEEPEIVPVVPRDIAPTPQEGLRRPITRKAKEEEGEEQFYLEPSP